MRILMTADTMGGVWGYTLELARALHDEAEFFLATMGAPLSESQWRDAAALPNVTVHESTFRLEWMDSPWDDVARAGEWLLDLEQQIAPDIIHLNGYAHGALTWNAPTLVVGHSCVLSWWEAVKGEPAPAAWAVYRDHVRRGLQSADAVAAPTAAMLKSLEQHYGQLPPRHVIYNGRRADAYRAADKLPIILAAGRLWDEAKNIAAVARAARSLPWDVVIAGDQHHPQGHEVTFEHVRLLGLLSGDELAGWMASASIFALPARYEPFGLAALEAGLSGCALVLGDIPSLRDVWGDAALFVNPNDDRQFTDTLTALTADDHLRAEYAERAQRRARQYTTTRMADGYRALYQTLRTPVPAHL